MDYFLVSASVTEWEMLENDYPSCVCACVVVGMKETVGRECLGGLMVKHQTLDFTSGHDLKGVRSSPCARC